MSLLGAVFRNEDTSFDVDVLEADDKFVFERTNVVLKTVPRLRLRHTTSTDSRK